jgi:hypothetical protein
MIVEREPAASPDESNLGDALIDVMNAENSHAAARQSAAEVHGANQDAFAEGRIDDRQRNLDSETASYREFYADLARQAAVEKARRAAGKQVGLFARLGLHK